jgi:tetratricopeptide (TPR) repeat protein
LALFLIPIFGAWKNIRKSEIGSAWNHKLIFPAFLAGYACYSCFDFPRARIEHIIVFNALLAICCSTFFVNATQKKLNVSKWKGYSIACLLLFIGFIGYKRYQGEYHTKEIYKLRALNKNEMAIQETKKALSFFYNLDPSSIPVLWYSGNSKIASGRYDEALKDFQLAAKQHPYCHYVLNDLGSVLYLTGKTEEAKKMYARAIAISPHYTDALLNLAQILCQENKNAEALELVKSAQNSPKKDQLLNLIYHSAEKKKVVPFLK